MKKRSGYNKACYLIGFGLVVWAFFLATNPKTVGEAVVFALLGGLALGLCFGLGHAEKFLAGGFPISFDDLVDERYTYLGKNILYDGRESFCIEFITASRCLSLYINSL